MAWTTGDKLRRPLVRRRDVGPTLQEYRRRSAALIDDAEPVLSGEDVDQSATRTSVQAALAQLRADWAAPLQSWRDHYAARADAAALIAQLEADFADADTEADAALAAKQWELQP